MAEFLPAFERMIVNEGGYVLHTVEGDRGGMTFAGIARNRWPNWAGWAWIDRGDTPSVDMVRGFYKANFWTALRLDEVENQDVARTLFDFAVNAGTGTAAKLAQIVVGTTPDGRFGPKTMTALNAANPELFVARYALAKLSRYEQIVTRDRTQGKFLLGWVRRTLKEAAA
jgi:lysozyme family protein